MTEPQKHPLMIEMESTHQDVLTLHPLLALLHEQEGSGEDPIMLIAELLAKIEARLATIEGALSISSSEPVKL
ncbi:hypothetical protein [Pelagibacterium lacus]|uniref:Uncharacterized protein n=1 Tax=Pelagibacterium lacus TaxID=2282655 RepID=A0A369WCQ6_9HYPH|nr:hypothetical protein [Pelagibacterium lacus]RDE09891.1 hypothetical protein DVH29_04995 [Pelagibacterium lacus]